MMEEKSRRTQVGSCWVTHLSFISPPVSEMLLRNYLEAAALTSFPVSHGALFWQSRGKAETSFARQVAMYLAHVSLGLNFTRVGVIFDRDRTTASHACCVVEDARDDKIIDRTIEMLEAASRMTVRRTLMFERAIVSDYPM
jgi:Bacterial dnaA protein helix-turn-helix